MAGESLAFGRLSAITGASSAAGGAAFSGIGFAAGLAAGFTSGLKAPVFVTASLDGDFTSVPLPPFMVCSASLPGFALAALPAVLPDLLALFIACAPDCPHPDAQTTMFLRSAIRSRGRAFAFYLSILSGLSAAFCNAVTAASLNGVLLSTLRRGK